MDIEEHLRAKGYQLINGQWFAPSRVAQSAQHQPGTGNEPVAKSERKIGDPVRRFVLIKSYRRRLVDRDGVWVKYLIDALRRAGILYDDTEEFLDYKVEQHQVSSSRYERTEITIT